ncbi:TorF family putative porin [Shewanella yunxiaonensis]|uniref:TorF family putative porin n=1 Tax=Shewanella yunxiaonensis TaxID=2829809 RepID=A0ABX7YU46_9GAMM|nr:MULTISPECIES: TorF family putative porin [Shewanella]MDF0534731.1 TorF family putative porin [Shewanella sp. A32]QUN06279.1 TorF family putative porin [Shewanella yunxiaonensis]
MKKTLLSLGTLAGLMLIAPMSQATVTGNIGATSNYLWRGVTQTANGAAVQGGIDYAHESGFYIGTWGSNVDFGDDGDTTYEMDIYGGFSNSINDDWSYDVGYLYYGYPDASGSIDFGELYGSLTWKWLEFGVAKFVTAGSDVAADGLDDKDYTYYHVAASYPLADSITLGAYYAYSTGDVITSWYGVDNYSEYNVSVTKDTSIGAVSFKLADTDLPGDDVKFVLGYTYEFEF